MEKHRVKIREHDRPAHVKRRRSSHAKRNPARNRKIMLSVIFTGFLFMVILSLFLFVLLPLFIDGKIIGGKDGGKYTVMESIVRTMNKTKDK
jgi:hypothetical protein